MNTDMTVEEALDRLEQINDALESGTLTLDDSIELYKEGVELSAMCKQKLDNARMQINILSEDGTEQDVSDDPNFAVKDVIVVPDYTQQDIDDTSGDTQQGENDDQPF